LLINFVAGRVSSVLSQFGYAFMLLRIFFCDDKDRMVSWDGTSRSLDQLLINLLAGRVSSVLSQFSYAFMLLRILSLSNGVYF
jgi:hypothetical protein